MSGPLNYPRFDQTSAGEFDNLDGLLHVQRRLKSGRNETVVFPAVVEPKLLEYSSDISYRTDVIVQFSGPDL